MVPKCVLCGINMFLDDEDIYYNLVEAYWFCPHCGWTLKTCYEKKSGKYTLSSLSSFEFSDN